MAELVATRAEAATLAFVQAPSGNAQPRERPDDAYVAHTACAELADVRRALGGTADEPLARLAARRMAELAEARRERDLATNENLWGPGGPCSAGTVGAVSSAVEAVVDARAADGATGGESTPGDGAWISRDDALEDSLRGCLTARRRRPLTGEEIAAIYGFRPMSDDEHARNVANEARWMSREGAARRHE